MSSYFDGHMREIEVAKAEALVKAAASMLDQHANVATKFGIMWELAFVQLRNLEAFRKPK